jgi:hypothetical protein
MNRLIFNCNLDAAKPDVRRLNDQMKFIAEPFIPRKGEEISFPFKKNGQEFSFSLAVVNVTYDYFTGNVLVELHIASPHRSIAEWMPWFEAFRGKTY